MPVNWPGFHALCIESVGADSVDVRLHAKSGPAACSACATRARRRSSPRSSRGSRRCWTAASSSGSTRRSRAPTTSSRPTRTLSSPKWAARSSRTLTSTPSAAARGLPLRRRPVHLAGRAHRPQDPRVPIPVTDDGPATTRLSASDDDHVAARRARDSADSILRNSLRNSATPPPHASAARSCSCDGLPHRRRVRLHQEVCAAPDGAVGAGDDGLVTKSEVGVRTSDADLHGARRDGADRRGGARAQPDAAAVRARREHPGGAVRRRAVQYGAIATSSTRTTTTASPRCCDPSSMARAIGWRRCSGTSRR